LVIENQQTIPHCGLGENDMSTRDAKAHNGDPEYLLKLIKMFDDYLDNVVEHNYNKTSTIREAYKQFFRGQLD